MRQRFALMVFSLLTVLQSTDGLAQQDAPENRTTATQHTDNKNDNEHENDNALVLKPNAHSSCQTYCIKATLEYGFTAVLTHSIQWGENGTRFNYVTEGRQSVLLPYWRPTLEVEFLRRHSVEFLYQPIYIDTEVTTQRDVQTDNVIFNTGTPMHVRYHCLIIVLNCIIIMVDWMLSYPPPEA